jgi:type I restriction enzyme S subunit
VHLRSHKTDEPPAGTRYVGLEHIESKMGRFVDNTDAMQTESESTVTVFQTHDVLFGKLRPYLAKAAVADTSGVCSSEILVLEPLCVAAPYLKLFLLLDGFIKTVDGSTFGSKMPRADWEFIGQQCLPIPPLAEQHAIAAHLDRETARIDALIAHAQEEMTLLKALRAATIADAVLGRVDVRTA